jgi:hypothetical protein
MKEIELTQGKVAPVDDVDWPEILMVKWCAHRHAFYAVREAAALGFDLEDCREIIVAREMRTC